MKTPRVLVDCSGGVIQGIWTDGDVEILCIDTNVKDYEKADIHVVERERVYFGYAGANRCKSDMLNPFFDKFNEIKKAQK